LLLRGLNGPMDDLIRKGASATKNDGIFDGILLFILINPVDAIAIFYEMWLVVPQPTLVV
jgi:hypothetical protein